MEGKIYSPVIARSAGLPSGLNKHVRTISLNVQYIVLFKNPRDSSQFIYLASSSTSAIRAFNKKLT